MEMFTVKKRTEVFELLREHFINHEMDVEEVELAVSVGRTLSEKVVSLEPIPSFRRSTVDGYAVKAKNTIGCSDALPSFLTLIGESAMGTETDLRIKDYEGVYVPTGGMLPEGSDAVVMIEYTEVMEGEVVINKPVNSLENVVGIGDDVREGEIILEEFTRIKPHHIGAFAALGKNKVKVFKKPRVAIISTGNEIVDIDQTLKRGQIRDVNSYSLAVMAQELGCNVVYQNRIRDEFESIKASLEQALELSDVVLISGGSSVGTHDMTPEIINSLGDPGVLVHGIAIKPGKPTIVAKVNEKAVFGLPGHPASCIISYKTVVEPFIRKTLLKSKEHQKVLIAKSGFQIHVSSGRDVFYMVKLEETSEGYVIHPVHGKSGMVSLLSSADGYIEIPMEKEGLNKGDDVKVYVF